MYVNLGIYVSMYLSIYVYHNFVHLIKKVYWIGPILGGICASILYNLILRASPAEEEPKPVATKEHA